MPRTRTPRPVDRPAPRATPKRVSATVARTPSSEPADRLIVGLTGSILDLLGKAGRFDAKARVDVGKLLSQVQAKLEHGKWLGWLEREVPFGAQSARNYIDLAQWAEAKPALFDKLAPLGSSKLYVIMRLADHLLGKLLSRPRHLVPSAGFELSLECMSFEQFLEVVGTLDRSPRVVLGPGEQALKRSLRQARSLVRNIAVLGDHAGDLPLEAVDELHDTLVTALEELLEHFDLD